MAQSHYSLRWNNHQTHILNAFDALLQSENLVDVTLVCAEMSVRAHKVVLSACSPFFQRIFCENPCKHPVIVLKDFSGWEVQAIVDFMYKGEISVVQEQLQNLIKAAESLHVRGLVPDEQVAASILNQTETPSMSPNDYDKSYYSTATRYPTPGATARTPVERSSPFSPSCPPSYEPTIKLPHMSRLSFPDTLLPRPECQSPIPRRKQARPRRRSGEMSGSSSNVVSEHHHQHHQAAAAAAKLSPPPPPVVEDAAPENLCVRKPQHLQRGEEEKTRTPETSVSPEIELPPPPKEYRGSPPPVSLPPTMSMKQEIENHSPLPFPPMPSVSALAMTPPHSKFFGLESSLSLFPPGLDGCRNPLFDMTDHHRTTPDSQLFVKKKMGRPKGQHSAPRGGPPRSWTNAELTEALQHVWNKKMTTSQASRIFGIPYNSLLMYVRGKYGKSLKLEQLRKDCIGGPSPSMDLLSMGVNSNSNNNNNACKQDRDNEAIQPNTRPSSTEEQQHQQPHPIFNPFQNFYPDFGTGFPIPVSMVHLLPQSEKSREHYGGGQQPPDDDLLKGGGGLKKEMEEEDLFRPPSLSVDDRRELVQQNGQD